MADLINIFTIVNCNSRVIIYANFQSIWLRVVIYDRRAFIRLTAVLSDFLDLRLKFHSLYRVQFISKICHYSSVDSSAPSILRSRVWVPSTPSTLSSIYIWIVKCIKDENKERKRPRLARISFFYKKSPVIAWIFVSFEICLRNKLTSLGDISSYKICQNI